MPTERDPEGLEPHYLHEFVPFAGARVLEVGSGDGRMTWRYADAARFVVGIEPDADRLAVARSSTPPPLRTKTAFVHGDATAVPFAKDAFDHVLLAWSL